VHVDLARLRSELWDVAHGRAHQLAFSPVYTRVYNLVTKHDLAQDVYALCVKVFLWMARRMGRKRYDLGVRLIVTLCMYLDQVWVRRHGYLPLAQNAAEVYDMPHVVAARRWRKAVRLVVRKQRILDWLVAFNQHAFRPKGCSAARVATHYAAFVAEHEA